MIQTKLIQPQYLAGFHCIGADCPDTCCQGWDVIIDKATYDRYRNLPACPLKSRLDSEVVRNMQDAVDATYALVTLTPAHVCPMLTAERLCSIQQAQGEEYLSVTCAVYPRVRNRVDGVLEMSLFMSCPEAARLALLDPNPMRFVEVASTPSLRAADIPLLDSADGAFTDKPYQYSGQVRPFVISLLQNRDYPLWQRLIILGLFCDALNGVVPERYDAEIPALIETFGVHVAEGAFQPTMEGFRGDLGVQLQIVTLLVDYLLRSGLNNARFLECNSAFNRGIEHSADADPAQTCLRYVEAYARYYQPFMSEHETILENYLVNYAFSTLFPFGPQKAIHLETRSIFTAYVLLAIHYAVTTGMLIGMAGHYRETFGSEHCVQLLQSYTKVAVHNLPYLTQAARFIEACGMSSANGTAELIRG